ncbi:MAG TPA: M48 family metallopeptidase [Longimicrobium sp.]|jgi:Zn-dependent protease with chaperone function|nr:M48 family metallopeptidase [Longimicrobium sp.]
MPDPTRTTRILTGIDSRSWEHPADRAALNALRRLPGFDEVLRKLFGMFGERQVRLAFLANAVRVSETQHPRLHALWADVGRTLDAPAEYPLYVTQNPTYNAAALGMDKPFVIVHSEMVRDFEDEELRFVLGHELGHVMSGHQLYTTMLMLLMALARGNFSLLGLAALPVVLALLEWSRKAELSCDRAGLLAVQAPEPGLRTMLQFAGGTFTENNLAAFVEQAEEYRDSSDLTDQVFKVLNLLWVTHPFPVIRVAEMRSWFESGEYDRIMAGEYRRRGEPDTPYRDDVQEAARSYKESAKETFGQAADAAKKVVDSFRSGFNRP